MSATGTGQGSRVSWASRAVPTYQGAAPVFVGLLFSLALLCTAFPHLHGRQAFSDLVPGYLAYHGGDKGQDFRAFALLVGLMVALPLLLAGLCRFIAPRGYRSGVGRAVQQLLLLSLVPAAWRLAVDAAEVTTAVPRFGPVSMFPLAALFALGLMARYRRTLTPAHVLTIGGAVVLTVYLSTFAAYGLAVACVRVIPPTYRLLADRGNLLPAVCVWTSVAVLAVLPFNAATIDQLQARVLKSLQGVQYPLLLLLFQLVSPAYVDPKHRFDEAYPALLVACLAGCVLFGWWTLWRRFHAAPPGYLPPAHRHPLARSLGPAAVAAVVVFVYCRTRGWPAFGGDDFHWGEQALPWPQLVTFHRVPYVDFVPIHGLMAYLPGGFNSLFFAGTAATYAKATLLFDGLAAAAVALAACLVVTPLGALVLLGAVLPDRDRTYFYVPAFLVLAAPQVARSPVRLLLVWTGLVLLLMAYNPTQGPAFAVATLPVGAWAAWRTFRTRPAAFAGLAAAGAAVVAAVLAVPPARHVCLAFVGFVADNASTNVVAHDIPWADGDDIHYAGWGPSLTQFLWEACRSFWVVVGFLCAAMFWKRAARPAAPALGTPVPTPRLTLLILTGTLPLYLILWSPWINGRLLPGIMAYPGDVSQTCLTWLAPVLVLLAVPFRRLPTALLALAAVTGFFYPLNPAPIDPAELADRSVQANIVPADLQVVDGAALGLPRLGTVVRSEEMTYLVPIKRFLDRFLRPGETYLDLTNRTALYYYLDLPCPVRYAPFVAANTRMQAAELRQLDAHPVPAVLLSPAVMIDMVSPEFRNYFIYRRYATTFSFTHGPDATYSFLVDPARGAALSPPALPVGTPAHRAAVDDYCYYMDDLQHLPASFGRSWAALANRFSPVTTLDPTAPAGTHDLAITRRDVYRVTGPVPWVEFAVPPRARSGKVADFLRVGFTFAPSPALADAPPGTGPRLQVDWTVSGPDTHARPFRFDAPNGELLIPLGAYPRWLLSDDLRTLRFELRRPQWARSFRFSHLEFLHLNDTPSP